MHSLARRWLHRCPTPWVSLPTWRCLRPSLRWWSAPGPLDILVCNAGIQGPAGPLANASDADWQQVFDINLRAAARLCALVLPGMAARGGGSAVLISSIAGLRGNRLMGLYGLTKAALAQLARNLAVEWGPHGGTGQRRIARPHPHAAG